MDARNLKFESLESREMLSYSVSGGVLAIDASSSTGGVDWSLEFLDHGPIKWRSPAGGDTLRFIDSEGITSIKFIGSDKRDVFWNQTSLPAEIRGAGGDDDLRSWSEGSRLFGGDGKDRLYLADKVLGEVYGGAGNDDIGGNGVLKGGGGDDDIGGYGRIYGGPGNDTIRGFGLSSIYGGAGDDEIDTHGWGTTNLFAEGSTLVNAGPGADFIRVYGGWNRIVAGSGDDIVDQYESFPDDDPRYVKGKLKVWGGDGVDNIGPFPDSIGTQIWGGNDIDTLKGSGYRDVIHGGNGADEIFGFGDNDKLYGDAGNDIIRGGSQRDKLFGGNGNDKLFGNAGNDELFGGNQNDQLYGGSNRDVLKGGPGADLLRGEAGKDNLVGGGGIDSLFGGLGSKDELAGGGGQDRIYSKSGDTTIRRQNGDAAFQLENGRNYAGVKGYNGGTWNRESDLKYIDKAFERLQSRAGSSQIIKDSINPNQPIRLHMVDELTSNSGQIANAVNFEYDGIYSSFNRIRIIAFNQTSLRNFGKNFQSTVIHEMAHNWDSQREIGKAFPEKTHLVNEFLGLSEWSSSNVGPTWIEASGDGFYNSRSEIFQKYGKQFAREYGAYSPVEDFATTFESAFRNTDYLGRAYNKIPEKISVVVRLFGL